LASADWMQHVSLVLKSATQMAMALEAGHPLLVHCSDGWDRTAQLAAIAQLLLDPFYRTIEGFRVLIEKDWCAFGHKFEHRNGLVKERDASPIFLQFLDCVWQIRRQFPHKFEFNDCILSFLAMAHTSGWFGNFLADCEKERRARHLSEGMSSVWDTILQDVQSFTSAVYKPVKDVYVCRRTILIEPNCDAVNLQLWPHFLSEHTLWNRSQKACVCVGLAHWSASEHAPVGSTMLAEGHRAVKPKDSVRVKVAIERNVTVWWKFHLEKPGNSIHFSVQSEGKVGVARKQYQCRQAVTGTCLCEAGNYVFIWDNLHSFVHTKRLTFEIYLADSFST